MISACFDFSLENFDLGHYKIIGWDCGMSLVSTAPFWINKKGQMVERGNQESKMRRLKKK